MIKCQCIRCNKEFQTTTKPSKYCSQLCRSSDRQEQKKEEVKLYKAQYYELNKETINDDNMARYYANKHILEKQNCDQCGVEYQPTRTDRKFCSNECGVTHWQLSHKDYIKQDQRDRYHNDVDRKISMCLRSRINKGLKDNVKSKSTMKLIGCSIDFLKKHLESQFEPWMTWENHGRYSKNRLTWQIDHIRPMSLYDLSDPLQQQEACNYINLQPMLAKNNLIKGKKYE
jgi:hypothetical protein